MREFFREIDQLLRGNFTRREDLVSGRITVPTRTLVTAGLALGAIYGVFMGLYSVMRPENASVAQMLATAVKVPLLFFLTLVVTFPSLYVFSSLARSRLQFADTLRLLLVAIGVDLAVLASFGPVTGFFTLSTESYPFMILLNVTFFGIAGLVGISLLRKAMDAVFLAPEKAPQTAEKKADSGEVDAEPAPRVRRTSDRPRNIFVVWCAIYGIVGAQMGWILRPFIGSPALPVELFRDRESNFFQAVLRTLRDLLS